MLTKLKDIPVDSKEHIVDNVSLILPYSMRGWLSLYKSFFFIEKMIAKMLN